MTLPFDPNAPDPYTGEGGNLKEPGAGWRNDLIEAQHLKSAMAPERDDGTDFLAGTDPELNKAWLQSLKHPIPITPGPCAWCRATTTRMVAYEMYQVKGRHWAFRGARQCEGCANREAIQKLERIAANPDVLPRLREEAKAELATMKAEAA